MKISFRSEGEIKHFWANENRENSSLADLSNSLDRRKGMADGSTRTLEGMERGGDHVDKSMQRRTVGGNHKGYFL